MAARKKAQTEAAAEVPTSTAAELSQVSENAGGTVVVALNRAQGIAFALSDGRKVHIAGNAVHLKGKEMGVLPIGAFGLTRIPAADWEEIQARYGKTALFKSGRIFASGTKSDAIAEAKDKEETRHGLEPTKGQATAEVKHAEVM